VPPLAEPPLPPSASLPPPALPPDTLGSALPPVVEE
jgi:hypothetical protein